MPSIVTVAEPRGARLWQLWCLFVWVLASPSEAAQVAVVASGTELPAADAPIDVRDLGNVSLWIAPDGVRIAWPQDALVLRKQPHEEFFLQREPGDPRDHRHHDLAPGGAPGAEPIEREVARIEGFSVIAADARNFSQSTLHGHCRERLRWLGPAPRAELITALARSQDPLVKSSLVDSVNHGRYVQILREFSGDAPAPLAAGAVNIVSRSTFTAGSGSRIDDAIDYVHEQWGARGYTVLEQVFPVGSYTARNLIAVREGTVWPDEVVVVGAHYDSRSEIPLVFAPGAEDNASGSAAVLHLAEIFAGYATERTVHFVLFGGEEQGLYGSAYYVSQLAANGWSAVGALTMDMISAWSEDYAVVIEGQLAWEPLMDVFAANVTEFAEIPFTKTFFSFGSDHVPFQQAGIPAFLAIDDDWDLYADYHLSTDTYDKVDATLGWRITRAIAGAVVDLAGATPLVDPVDAPPSRTALELEVNVPNPFNPRTELGFVLPSAGPVLLEIFDVRGRRVAVLLDSEQPAGRSSVVWSGSDDEGAPVGSGTYLARLRHAAGERTRRMVLIR